jgi:hypothetical protein
MAQPSQAFSARPLIQEQRNHSAGTLIGDIRDSVLTLLPWMDSLQCQVSQIKERHLRNWPRPWCEITDIFSGQSLVIARCVWDIKLLQNELEVCSHHPVDCGVGI